MPEPLTEQGLAAAVRKLVRRDADLDQVVRAHGLPPLWARDPSFSTLVLLILEQQVSLASARATYGRLEASLGGIRPERIARLDEDDRKAAGVTRQKAGYLRGLAEAIVSGALSLPWIASLSDQAAHDYLTHIKGIGSWTSDIYLLMALRRPDIWPRGDLALVTAACEVKRLARRPTRDEMETLAEPWRPWRAVAARILWHYYLSTPRQRNRAARPGTGAPVSEGTGEERPAK